MPTATDINFRIYVHEDGVHCGVCRGRYWDGTRCSFFLRDVQLVSAVELGAVRLEECLKAEVT